MRSAPKFMQLLRDAKASGVLVEEVTWARLAQMTGGAVHQGIALQTAAADTLNLPDLIEGCGDLNEPPLLLALMDSRIPTTLVQSCDLRKRWEPTVWCCLSAAVQVSRDLWPKWPPVLWSIFPWPGLSI